MALIFNQSVVSFLIFILHNKYALIRLAQQGNQFTVGLSTISKLIDFVNMLHYCLIQLTLSMVFRIALPKELMTFKPTNGSQQHINQLVHVLVLALRDMACMKCNYHVSLLTLFNYRVPCKHQTIFSGAQIKLKTLWRWQVGLRDFWHKLPSKAFEIKRKCGWKEENRKVDFIKILFPRPFF